jgi:hypothetical protein
MMHVEEGYQVAFDLPQVVALAELAVAADPHAAMEVARDGSRLRFTAGPTTRLVALGREGRASDTPLKLAFDRRHPVTYTDSPSGVSELAWMRSCLALGARRLYLTRKPAVPSRWVLSLNPDLDQRREPYSGPYRYKLMPTSRGCYLLDLETGLPYRTRWGQAAVRGPQEKMRELADRLNSR